MSLRSRPLLACLLCIGVTALAVGAVPARQQESLADALDRPTPPSDFARKGVASAIARHGDRLLAVGPRGLILMSIDAGVTWTQAPSPVSTDLVAVKFADADNAWAVGHDAVALRTMDGGATWQKVLDGRSVYVLLRDTYGARAKAGDGDAATQLREIEHSMAQSATPDVLPSPFLDVWFANADEGYLVGAFGLILRTTDGGKQWVPWNDRLDNERRLHLYAITGDDTQRYIAGEQGLLLRLDAATGRFVKHPSPYEGSYFGLDLHGPRLLAFGLRGNAFIQHHPGAAWNKVETGVDANIVAAVNMSDDRLVLISQDGQLLAVSPDLRTATALNASVMGEVLGAVASSARRLALARLNGVATIEIDIPSASVPTSAPTRELAGNPPGSMKEMQR